MNVYIVYQQFYKPLAVFSTKEKAAMWYYEQSKQSTITADDVVIEEFCLDETQPTEEQ